MQNEQDLEMLVHAHTAALLRYCTGLLGCEADAQDAVQKTFIKAWQQRHTLRHDGTDNERAWLYRIAYRTSLDMLRAIKRAAATPPRSPLEQDPGISEELRTALNTLARWIGPDLTSVCWTGWIMPHWRAFTDGPPPICAHATTRAKKAAGAAIEGGGAL